MLAISLVIFNIIHILLSVHFLSLLNRIEIANNMAITHINIDEYNENHQEILNPSSILRVIIDRIKIAPKMYKKFLIFGNSSESLSSSTGSCLIHKYQLYHTSSANKIAHSRHITCWSHKKHSNRQVINTRKNQSLRTSFFWIKIGATIALSPRMNHRLNMFDQTIFQTDIDQFPLSADIAERNSSGADVQIARMVKPINNGDNLKNLAILTLELISLSAANHSNAKPATRIKMASTMVVFLFK